MSASSSSSSSSRSSSSSSSSSSRSSSSSSSSRSNSSSSSSSSSSIFIPNRIQEYNTVFMTDITNSRVIIDVVMWFCWWPLEKPWAYQAARHDDLPYEDWKTELEIWQAFTNIDINPWEKKWTPWLLTVSSLWADGDQNGPSQPWLSRDLGRDWAVT